VPWRTSFISALPEVGCVINEKAQETWYGGGLLMCISSSAANGSVQRADSPSCGTPDSPERHLPKLESWKSHRSREEVRVCVAKIYFNLSGCQLRPPVMNHAHLVILYDGNCTIASGPCHSISTPAKADARDRYHNSNNISTV
jgi:hypothetical protein